MVSGQCALLKYGRRLFESRKNFRASHRQVLSRTDIKRHPFPTPGVDFQLQGREGFHLRFGGHSFFFSVVPELSADEIADLERWNRLQDFDLLITNRFTVCADRRLHRQVAQKLKEMVLDHVTNGSGLIVKSASPLHTELLSHGDLYALDVVAIPERLHQCVGEPEKYDVVDRLLAKIVVNAKNIGFGKSTMQDAIQLFCGSKVVAERLFDNDPRALGTARFR